MIYFKVISNMVHVKIDRELQVKSYEQKKATEPKNMVHYRTYGMLRTVDASFSSWYLCLWLCFILILNIFLFISRNFGSSYLLLGTFSFNFRIGKCNVRWDFRRWIIYFPQVFLRKENKCDTLLWEVFYERSEQRTQLSSPMIYPIGENKWGHIDYVKCPVYWPLLSMYQSK